MGPTTEAVDTGVPSAAVADAIDKRAGRSPSQIAWDRLKSDKVAIGSLVIVVFFVLVAIFAPLLVALEGEELNKYHPELISAANTYPIIGATPQHWFGVEPRTGRDLFAVWAWGARPSLIIGFTAATFSTLLGIAIGLTAGYLGGVVDKIITWIIDVLLSLPFLLMVLALVPVIQSRFTKPGEVLTAEQTSGIRFWVLIAILVFFGWIGLARLIRGEVLSLREREFVEASRSIGATDRRIIFREILPNLVAPIIVYATVLVPQVILTEAALSFLGIGIDPDKASWGAMISDATSIFQDAWWFMLYPGIALLITVLAFNIVGDGLQDALNPRTGAK